MDPRIPKKGPFSLYANETTVYYLDGSIHCDSGPAYVKGDISAWAVEGISLGSKYELLAKSILDDPTIAPLYINHPPPS